METHDATREKVRAIFSSFLEEQGLRKTPERFSILDEVYRIDDHFDVDSLYIYMKNKKFRVSRATIYNTIEHLLACKLITRHQFGKNLAKFEKSYAFRQHDHLICSDCEKVFEFCDPRIQQIQTMMGDILNFTVTHHSLNLYGKCNRLIDTGKCENILNHEN
jgi:Fur family transcriptional regulator, ferric uptake regulator